MGIANFLVLLHTWNLWDRNKRLVYSTYILFVLTQITQLICGGVVIFNLVGSLTYDNQYLKHCVLANNSMFFLLYTPGLVFEAVAFVLAAYMSLWTPRNATTKLCFVLYRDGLAYYVPLVSLRIISIILAAVATPSLIFLCTYFLWAVGLTTINRLLLRLRRISVKRSSGDHPVCDGTLSK
ncbi:hypothetical protein L218DRAFT_224203 [Marasmius fiardii PR-910]|nr:hypothetical protein L218DRAFT_224203 [Marasmius fiardii PR-910]